MADKELYQISELLDRYGLESRQSIYDRIKGLGIEPVARGKLSSQQVDRLDALDKFLRENPGKAIADFPINPEVVPAKLEQSAVLVSEAEPDIPTGQMIQLIEALSKYFAPQQAIASSPDPLAHYEQLEKAVAHGWQLKTSEVKALIGVKPHCKAGEDTFLYGSFQFTKAGRMSTEFAWKVAKA